MWIFKNKLHRLIDDPVEVKKLANNALEKVQHMSWDSIIKKYNDLYNSIV